MITIEHQARAYFGNLGALLVENRNVSAICVAHMVPNSVAFLEAINRLHPIRLVLRKPQLEASKVGQVLAKKYRSEPLDRDWTRDSDRVVATISDHLPRRKRRFVLVDIGGYFSTSVSAIHEAFDDEFLGIVEGTENGVDKYLDAGADLPVPVLTAARSPLKYPENHLVGVSVVFSIEAILRSTGQILQTLSACVIGFGRVGRSAAESLRGRGVTTVVFDVDPVALAEASARGYQIAEGVRRYWTISASAPRAAGPRQPPTARRWPSARQSSVLRM